MIEKKGPFYLFIYEKAKNDHMCESYKVIKLATRLLLELHPHVDAKTIIPPQKNKFPFAVGTSWQIVFAADAAESAKAPVTKRNQRLISALLRSASTHRCQSAAENNPRPIAIMQYNHQTVACGGVWTVETLFCERGELYGLDVCN